MTSFEEKYRRQVQRECRNPFCPNPDTDPRKLMDCSRCKQACYCSKECQVAHWKEHKGECRACVKDGAMLIAHMDKKVGPARWHMSEKVRQELDQLLMEEWKASMTPRELMIGLGNRDEVLKRLGITPDIVTGLPVGAWNQVMKRRYILDQKINYKNDPPLQVGDNIEVLAGNYVKWTSVGQRGTLSEYHAEKGKWGVDFEDGEAGMVMTGNLKRV